jgi:hypothetical protein
VVVGFTENFSTKGVRRSYVHGGAAYTCYAYLSFFHNKEERKKDEMYS